MRNLFTALIALSVSAALSGCFSSSGGSSKNIFSSLSTQANSLTSSGGQNLLSMIPPLPLAMGYDHSCAIIFGALKCWGSNQYGQLGINSSTSSTSPVQVANMQSDVTAVAAGQYNTFAVKQGKLYSWGNGIGMSPGAASGVLDSNVSHVFVSVGGHFCAIKSGALYCWGNNWAGQVGDGTTTYVSDPILVAGMESGVISAALSSYGTCALKNTGALYCWGYNGNGEVGDGGSGTNRVSPVLVPGMESGVTKVFSGSFGYSNCAINGTNLYCWGVNGNGQLGNGITSNSSTPALISASAANVTQISLSNSFSCGLSNGGVFCTGDGTQGQLGQGSTSSSFVAQPVIGLSSGVTAISAGNNHICAIQNNSTFCWGNNDQGQVGVGKIPFSNTPLTVSLSNYSNVFSKSSAKGVCASNSSGAVSCWGQGGNGQIGNNLGQSVNSSPSLIFSSGVTSVGTAYYNTCFVVANQLKCTGNNNYGQLANIGSYQVSTPVLIPTLDSNVTATTAGGIFNCAIKSGSLYCWGNNDSGQLGKGDNVSTSVVGSAISIGGSTTGITSVAAGESHTCAIKTVSNVNSLYCWGANGNGQLGNGNTNSTNAPGAAISIAGSTSGVTAVSASAVKTCAIKNGSLYCWGNNVSSPTLVSGISGVTQVSVGSEHVCALDGTFHLYCWGKNNYGQLGDGTLTDSLSPSAPVMSHILSVAAGDGFTCAVQSVLNGSNLIKCWGNNEFGELGQNDSAPVLSPASVAF